jgi:hypothetical protein
VITAGEVSRAFNEANFKTGLDLAAIRGAAKVLDKIAGFAEAKASPAVAMLVMAALVLAAGFLFCRVSTRNGLLCISGSETRSRLPESSAMPFIGCFAERRRLWSSS